MKILDAAHNNNPNANWWLKGDGCDLVSGLQESMWHEWNGDANLDDGDLEQKYKAYSDLLGFYKALRIGDDLVNGLEKCCQILLKDKEFILTGTACTCM